jgi:hypothetical protein
VQKIPLRELIELCSQGNQRAIEELEFRWNINWHDLDRQVDRLKGENR